MKENQKTILSILALFFLIAISFLWWEIGLPLDEKSTQTVYFIVEKGDTANKIAQNLVGEDLIKSGSIFKFYVFVTGASGHLQAGRYELSPAMSISEILNKISNGKIATKKISIPEGLTLKDIALQFEEQGICVSSDFLNAAKKDFSSYFSFLASKPKRSDLEGYLFPDTYEIFPETSADTIIKKMLNNFDGQLTPELRQEITSQKKSIFEIITMASIIEKEVKTPKDKKIVSGVLWKRIDANMPLQVDSTVNYITGKNDDGASFEDITIDSPYNTYKYAGLPIGPISNPGLDSIIAAIYPEKSSYWYYLSTKDGKTIFSKTFAEHQAARRKYGV